MVSLVHPVLVIYNKKLLQIIKAIIIQIGSSRFIQEKYIIICENNLTAALTIQ